MEPPVAQAVKLNNMMLANKHRKFFRWKFLIIGVRVKLNIMLFFPLQKSVRLKKIGDRPRLFPPCIVFEFNFTLEYTGASVSLSPSLGSRRAQYCV
jgi:hypothetical protein